MNIVYDRSAEWTTQTKIVANVKGFETSGWLKEISWLHFPNDTIGIEIPAQKVCRVFLTHADRESPEFGQVGEKAASASCYWRWKAPGPVVPISTE